jgi:hypothetical protein
VKYVGPTIAKSKQAPLMQRSVRPLVRCTDYRWRELFEDADVISEGAARKEDAGAIYYGCTSILLSNRSHGGSYDDADGSAISQLLTVDPHARIRAIRIACLEAELRAKSPIDSLRAELLISEDPRGVRITVDVEARILVEADARSSAAQLKKRTRR